MTSHAGHVSLEIQVDGKEVFSKLGTRKSHRMPDINDVTTVRVSWVQQQRLGSWTNALDSESRST